MKFEFSRKNKLAVAILGGLTFAGTVMATDEPFNATMTLLAPIVITETQGLTFPTVAAGSTTPQTVAPAAAAAAIFTATGSASTGVTASVVESSIEMVTGDGVGTTKRITVDNFVLGGNVTGGTGTFDGSGNLADMRVGATANPQSDDIAGAYSGTATFRLIY